MSAAVKLAPDEAADVARQKALGHGLSPERAEKRAVEARDMAYIGLIADRAVMMSADAGARTGVVILMMQVKAANSDLDLKVLYEFDDFNFAHDISGIFQYATPGSGVLKNHFSPRATRA
ncbi:hypothetical protein CPT_Sonora_068 [Stenotrophomonas phage Sonora]|nr:hypothetical protein CPT_Sonora_068 [Stenotrophomonas phage Sonora]